TPETFSAILLLTIVLLGCNHQVKKISIETEIEDALSKTLTRFPQYKPGKLKDYHLIRSLMLGESGVELQLRSNNQINQSRSESIIVAIDTSGHVYIIPLMSNSDHFYWGFAFESETSSDTMINSNFGQELKNCLSKLKITYDSGYAQNFINEMMVSLLQCTPFMNGDNLGELSMAIINVPELKDENEDSCTQRFKKINREMHRYSEKTGFTNINTNYWDKQNARGYKFNWSVSDSGSVTALNISTYRLDCDRKIPSFGKEFEHFFN
ncbi:MAG: hypothetical protein ABW036_02590, partial [Flavitalea sp.]